MRTNFPGFFLAAVAFFLTTFWFLLEVHPKAWNRDAMEWSQSKVASYYAAHDEFKHLVDLNIKLPTESKVHGMLWVYPDQNPNFGVASNFRSDKKLFQRLFPNFSNELREDDVLWQQYFGYTFDQYYVLPEASDRFDSVVNLSFGGCLEIATKYMPSTIVLGASEVMRALDSVELAKALDAKDGLLRCEASGGNITTIIPTLEILKDKYQRKKIQSLIIGYSEWWPYTNSVAQKLKNSENLAQISLYSQNQGVHSTLSNGYQTLSDYMNRYETIINKFNAWTMPYIVDADSLVTVLTRLWANYSNSGIDTSKAPRPEIAHGGMYLLNFAAAPNSQEIIASLKDQKTEFVGLTGVSEKDCLDPEALQQLEKLITLSKDVAETVYIYLHPITPTAMANAPSCFKSRAKELLDSINVPGVIVATDSWKDYGLDYTDFLHRDISAASVWSVDWNHPNYSGLVKISTSISNWIAKHRKTMHSDKSKNPPIGGSHAF